ncbi:hypothetical protein SEMRO_76_G041840.1 [Seminavis robusta]|uniref:Uncharacterized protein n=1 Tax=Seminavis robusta TaxID=568900 RepID=A0A9N8DBJ0_9STRA|nr:hypothetical protein SEMRO_76_G041840.1 [Seminavis robusta]|eukprot:Sro76_g041840.1 n/a (138) ;mRNA; f:128235-128819
MSTLDPIRINRTVRFKVNNNKEDQKSLARKAKVVKQKKMADEERLKDRRFLDQLVEPRSFVHVARAFVNNRQVGLLLDDFLVQHGITQATPGLTVQEANLSQRLAALAHGNHNIDPQTLRGLRIFFRVEAFTMARTL